MYAITYYTMLDHLLKIRAQERVEQLTNARVPNLNDKSVKDLFDKQWKIIDGNETPVKSRATIERDRRRLRKLIKGTK